MKRIREFFPQEIVLSLVVALILCAPIVRYAPSQAADMGGCKVVTPTPGAAVTVTVTASVRHTVAVWTSGEVETINISGTPQDGATLTMIVTNDATLGRVLTAGTGLSALAVITGVASKKSTISFEAYNGTFYETGRTVGF